MREVEELDETAVDWIGTKHMLADGLTKVLPGPSLSDVRDKLHLVDVGPPPCEACGGVLYGESNRGQASTRTTIQRMCQPQEAVQT